VADRVNRRRFCGCDVAPPPAGHRAGRDRPAPAVVRSCSSSRSASPSPRVSTRNFGNLPASVDRAKAAVAPASIGRRPSRAALARRLGAAFARHVTVGRARLRRGIPIHLACCSVVAGRSPRPRPNRTPRLRADIAEGLRFLCSSVSQDDDVLGHLRLLAGRQRSRCSWSTPARPAPEPRGRQGSSCCTAPGKQAAWSRGRVPTLIKRLPIAPWRPPLAPTPPRSRSWLSAVYGWALAAFFLDELTYLMCSPPDLAAADADPRPPAGARQHAGGCSPVQACRWSGPPAGSWPSRCRSG